MVSWTSACTMYGFSPTVRSNGASASACAAAMSPSPATGRLSPSSST